MLKDETLDYGWTRSLQTVGLNDYNELLFASVDRSVWMRITKHQAIWEKFTHPDISSDYKFEETEGLCQSDYVGPVGEIL